MNAQTTCANKAAMIGETMARLYKEPEGMTPQCGSNSVMIFSSSSDSFSMLRGTPSGRLRPTMDSTLAVLAQPPLRAHWRRSAGGGPRCSFRWPATCRGAAPCAGRRHATFGTSQEVGLLGRAEPLSSTLETLLRLLLAWRQACHDVPHRGGNRLVHLVHQGLQHCAHLVRRRRWRVGLGAGLCAKLRLPG